MRVGPIYYSRSIVYILLLSAPALSFGHIDKSHWTTSCISATKLSINSPEGTILLQKVAAFKLQETTLENQIQGVETEIRHIEERIATRDWERANLREIKLAYAEKESFIGLTQTYNQSIIDEQETLQEARDALSDLQSWLYWFGFYRQSNQSPYREINESKIRLVDLKKKLANAQQGHVDANAKIEAGNANAKRYLEQTIADLNRSIASFESRLSPDREALIAYAQQFLQTHYGEFKVFQGISNQISDLLPSLKASLKEVKEAARATDEAQSDEFWDAITDSTYFSLSSALSTNTARSEISQINEPLKILNLKLSQLKSHKPLGGKFSYQANLPNQMNDIVFDLVFDFDLLSAFNVQKLNDAHQSLVKLYNNLATLDQQLRQRQKDINNTLCEMANIAIEECKKL